MENLDWKVGELMNVPIDMVLVDENQPRETLDDAKIEELTISMRHEGFKSHKHIDCLPPVNGKFPAVNGNHRLTAAGKVGITTVPIMIMAFDGDKSDLELEQCADNSGLNMKPLEILNTAQRALEAGKSIVHVAKKLGKSAASLRDDLPILGLPPEIKNLFNKGKVPKVVARRLAVMVVESAEAEKANKEAGRVIMVKKNVMTAWKWANKDNSNAEKMMAGITAYEQEVSQSAISWFEKHDEENAREMTEQEKGVICQHDNRAFTFNDAAKLYDRLEKIVGQFDKSPIGNGHGPALFTAKKNSARQIEMLAKAMVRMGKKIETEAAVYMAAH